MSHPDQEFAEVDAVAAHQREMQRQQDTKDAEKRAPSGSDGAVQAGAREQPSQMTAQHLEKPGHESDLQLRPRFLAPDYEGSHKLRGMVAIVTGGDSGIGRAVSVLFAREGADVAIVYLNEHEDAEETRRCIEAEGRRCILLPGDVKDFAFCRQAVDRTVSELGKLDLLVNNAAFQEHADS